MSVVAVSAVSHGNHNNANHDASHHRRGSVGSLSPTPAELTPPGTTSPHGAAGAAGATAAAAAAPTVPSSGSGSGHLMQPGLSAAFGFPSFSVASDVPSEDRDRLMYTRSFKPETPSEFLHAYRRIVLGALLVCALLGVILVLASVHDLDGGLRSVSDEIDVRTANFADEDVAALYKTRILGFERVLREVNYTIVRNETLKSVRTLDDLLFAKRFLWSALSLNESNTLEIPLFVSISTSTSQTDVYVDSNTFDLPEIPLWLDSPAQPRRWLRRACFVIEYPIADGFESSRNTKRFVWGLARPPRSCFFPFSPRDHVYGAAGEERADYFEVEVRSSEDPFLFVQEVSEGTMVVDDVLSRGAREDATPINVIIAGVALLVIGGVGTVLFIVFLFWVEASPKRDPTGSRVPKPRRAGSGRGRSYTRTPSNEASASAASLRDPGVPPLIVMTAAAAEPSSPPPPPPLLPQPPPPPPPPPQPPAQAETAAAKELQRERKALSRAIKQWRRAYKAQHGRKPTRDEVRSDPTMGPIYARYKSLSSEIDSGSD